MHSPCLQGLYIQGRERLSPREWSPARIENLRVVGGVPSYVAIAQMPTPPISFFPTNCGRPQLDNLNLMARFEGFRVIGRLGRLPGKPIRPHFLLHQLICNASRLVTFIFDISRVKQNKVSSWLRNNNWSQNMAMCVRFVLFFEPLYLEIREETVQTKDWPKILYMFL